MKTDNATPRPWRVVEGNKIVANPNRTVIADTYGYADDYKYQPHRDANAELIVRAVNSHEAMKAALELVQSVLGDRNRDGSINSLICLELIIAIALAEGKGE